MKKILLLVLGGLVILASFGSCAKKNDPSWDELVQTSFDAWMSLYGEGAEKQASGMYIKKLKTGTGTKSVTEPTQWVRVNYTGRVLTSGDVYVSRDAEVAKQQGTFQYYIHYIPDYLSMLMYSSYPTDYYPIEGLRLALNDMKEGDVWRLYIPSNLAYGSNTFSSSNSYFAGQNALEADTPIILEVELLEIVDDPAKDEQHQVQTYAVSQLNVSLADTIGPDIYYKVYSTIADQSIKIEKDSTVNYYYVGRFMDGFVFDTNIKDTADKYHLTQYNLLSTYQLPLSTTVGASSDDGGVVGGLDSMLHHISYGDVAECVFTSESMYGTDGSFSTTATIIPPYTPVIFQVWTSPLNGNGSQRFPYSVEGVQALQKEVDNVWVTGYAKGVVTGENALDTLQVDLSPYPDTEIRDNIMLATSNGVISDPAKCIPVQLATPSLQAALNLQDNSDLYYSYPIKVCGNLRRYKGTWGLVDISQYEVVYYTKASE